MRRLLAIVSRPAAPREDQAGFTLIELLMGIVLASIFSLALYGFFFAGLDAFRTHESQARAQSTGRTAVGSLERDIRQAISPDDSLTVPVIALSPTSLEIYVDPQRSATVTQPRPQKVHYAIIANQFIRETSDPVNVTPPFSYGPYVHREVLIDTVQNGAIPAFSAVTNNGDPLAATVGVNQLRDIAQISVRILASQKTGNSATSLELRTDVFLRNANRL